MAVTTRKTADERREAVLDAALVEFAARGLDGASTEAIAAAAGISQPYVFRLFGTKKELFKAGVARCFRETLELFQRAAEGKRGEEALEAMGTAYIEQLLPDRTRLQAQMQAYAACNDPEIGEVTRREFGRLWREVAALSGQSEDCLQEFFAKGMLMNVLAAMDATSHPSQWVKACIPPAWLTPAVRTAS